MKKKLIGPHNLEEFILADKGILQVGPEHILSPGARDAARNRGISIVYGNSVQAGKSKNLAETKVSATEDSREELGRKVVLLLKTEFNLSDPGMIRDVTLKVLKRIEETK